MISIRCEIPIVFKAGSETDFTNVAELYFELANKYLYKHNNPRKALKCINKSVKFLPYEEKYLAFHGLCSQISGNILEARKYWNRIAELAKRNNNTEVINFMSDISGQPVDKQLYHNLIRLVNN